MRDFKSLAKVKFEREGRELEPSVHLSFNHFTFYLGKES